MSNNTDQPQKKFKKTVEDFACEMCGFQVSGNGYTNHCPNCLWSKHVDVNPGDRLEKCGGMMKPTGLEKRGDDFYIIQICEKCHFEWKNKAQKGDNFNKIIELSKITS